MKISHALNIIFLVVHHFFRSCRLKTAGLLQTLTDSFSFLLAKPHIRNKRQISGSKHDFYMYPESTGIRFTTGRQLFILLTTDVVPSPTSLSCRSASSQRTLAAGCSTSSSLRMVAPSLVMVTSYRSIIKMSVLYIFLIHEKTLKNMRLTPMSSTNILSRPTGPRELLTMLAIDAAAMTAQITKKMKS